MPKILEAPFEPEIDIQTVLGEGPVWDAHTELLHFVDVGSNCVFHYEYASKKLEVDYYDGCVASIALRKDHSGFIAAAQGGFAFLPARVPDSTPEKPASIEYFANPAPDLLPASRMFNDGICDSKGRFIAGSKTRRGDPFNEHLKPGTFWRVEKVDGEWKTEQLLEEGFTVPNGVGFSKDGSTFYLNDTRGRPDPFTLAFDYDQDSGKLSNRRIFATTEYAGRPDGMCHDEEDCIWVAKYAGCKVTRYRPDGSIDMEVRFPSSLNITACVFGGKDMNVLFVTTGSLKESGDEHLADKYPHCGAVFAMEIPGVRGRAKGKFGW